MIKRISTDISYLSTLRWKMKIANHRHDAKNSGNQDKIDQGEIL